MMFMMVHSSPERLKFLIAASVAFIGIGVGMLWM